MDPPARLAIALLACLALACGQLRHVDTQDEARPETDLGVGATVMYPGQPAPPLGSQTRTGDLTAIGGSHQEKSLDTKDRSVPIVGPLLTLFGYPFWIFGKDVHEKADAAQRQETPARPPLTSDEAERQRLLAENERLRRELARPGGAQPPFGAAPTGLAPAIPTGAPTGTATSISQELVALERSLGVAPQRPARAPAEARGARVARDEDGDGRLDRLLVYDAGDRLVRSEEDLDGDGRLESVTLYDGGEVVRKRVDTDADGIVDSWSFFRDGELVRHEVDRDGDGFRDLVMFYAAGELVREEEDRNGDGRTDVTVVYDGGDVVERHEDVDFDGTPDVLSFYERGKLVRREVRSEGLLEPGAAP